MRKVFREPKYQRYAIAKSAKLMRRRNSRNKHNKAVRIIRNQPERDRYKRENRNRLNQLRLNKARGREETIVAPKKFSLIEEEEPYPTFTFFSQLWDFLYEGFPVLLDLKDVEEMTPEVILYLLSIMEIFKSRNALQVSGNCPKHEKCKKVFQQSGFYQYVQSNFRQTQWNKEILTIRHGKSVIGEIANEVGEFAKYHLPEVPSSALKASYRILAECMGNTKEHAYATIDFPGNWWMMAYARENDVLFCILDNGRGIPKTMRKRFGEKFYRKEFELISSTMKGVYKDRFVRSSSGKRTRGKGLPAIYRPYASGIIKDLTVVSGKGFVPFAKGQNRELEKPFRGTMVSWTLPKGFMGG